MVAARRRGVHRRGAQDVGGQVLEEDVARPFRRLRAAHSLSHPDPVPVLPDWSIGPRQLEGRVAFITGAGRGIGRAIARAYAAEGAAVVCAARSRDEIEALAGELSDLGQSALAVECDVAELVSVERAVSAAVEAFGGLDLVVANAGTVNPLQNVGNSTQPNFAGCSTSIFTAFTTASMQQSTDCAHAVAVTSSLWVPE